jgi:hypothetical protein
MVLERHSVWYSEYEFFLTSQFSYISILHCIHRVYNLYTVDPCTVGVVVVIIIIIPPIGFFNFDSRICVPVFSEYFLKHNNYDSEWNALIFNKLFTV